MVINKSVDMLVLGAGASGIAAAITAAEADRSVLLVEQNGFSGGMATAAYVGTICGMYFRSKDEIGKYVCDGFARKFTDALKERSNSQVQLGLNGIQYLPYDRQAFIDLADSLLNNAGVSVQYHATLTEVKFSNSQLISAKYFNKIGEHVVAPKIVIDCSGNAVVGQLIGDIVQSDPRVYQAGAFVFAIKNVNIEDWSQINLYLYKAIRKAIEKGDIEEDKSMLTAVPGSGRGDQVYLKLSLPHVLHESPNSISLAHQYARNRMIDCIQALKKNELIFKNVELFFEAPTIGVRTGPRYKGREVLAVDHVLNATKTDRSAARGAWPIEFWSPGEKVKMKYFKENDYYDIPEGCLLHHSIGNLLFAGRHISAEEEAIASARVIGTCLQMGEHAGKMAVQKLNEINE